MRTQRVKKIWKTAAIACLMGAGFILTSVWAMAETTGTLEGGLTYELGDDGVLTISGDGELNCCLSDCLSDYESDESPVSDIVKVVIGDGVTGIAGGAFSDFSSLESIEIPSGVMSIAGDAFLGCSSLESIIVDENNSVYDSREGCNAIIESGTNKLIVGCKNTVIPSDVECIGNYAFYGCSGLTGICIPAGVTQFEATENENYGLTFFGCSSLESITVDENNPVYDSRENCNAVIMRESDDMDGAVLIVGCKNTVIPDGVTRIQNGAFWGCKGLESIEIPDSVTSIGNRAFYGCSSMKDICVPESVISIGDYAFSGCNSLEDICVPDSVTDMGDYVFLGCNSLAEIKIPENVTSIGDGTFSFCRSLISICIPDCVTRVGDSAFSGCNSLTSIELPSGVASIGNYAFDGCINLTDVYYSGSRAEWNQIDIGSYNGCLTNATIHYGKLSTPAVTTVTTSAGINVKWTAVDDAESYIVYRKTSGGTYSVIKTITNPATLNYVDTTPVSGTVYYYTVRAAATGKTKSDYVSSAAVKYLAPSAVTAITNTSSGVKITWKTVTGASGYHVYRKSGSGSYSLIKTVSGVSSSTYTDTTAVSGTSYTYAVRAAYGKYEGSYTAVKTTKFLGAVTVSSISNVSTGLQIKWSKVTGATGYKIYRKVGSNSFAYIKTVSGASTVSYIDTTAVNGTTYKYTVRAVYGSYLGSYTNCKTLTRVAPTAFTGAKNSAAGSLSLTWSKNAKASGYLIQYSTSSSFSTYTNVRVTSASTVAKTISSLTKGKTYYVRIRAYQTVDGSNVYSTWSAVKSVKITQ